MSQSTGSSIDLEYLTIRSRDDDSFNSYSFIDDSEDEDEGTRVSNNTSEYETEQDGPSFVDYLIEAYDSLMSRFSSMEAVALASHVALRRINQNTVIKQAVKLVGNEATHLLAIIGSIQGTNTKKIDKKIKLICHGVELTVQQLVEANLLSKRGSKYDSSSQKIHLNTISAAIPYATFEYLTDGSSDQQIPRKKYRNRIETSLPPQLQYLEAGSLPLGTKTRKAHLLWASSFLESINCKFNPAIYKRLMKQSVMYEKMDSLVDKLESIEASLTLKPNEESIQVGRFFKKYYAIAQKEKSKESRRAKKKNINPLAR